MGKYINKATAIKKLNEVCAVIPIEVHILENCIEKIEEMRAIDAVSMAAYKQVQWERDVAFDQLESYGIGFAEKPAVVKIARCKDCNYFNNRKGKQ